MAVDNSVQKTKPVIANILGSVICTPQTAAVGESITVEVRGPDGKPYDNNETTPITINGVPGSKQFLVWNTAGTKNVRVIASRRDAPSEKMSTTVNITPAAAGKTVPRIAVSWTPGKPAVAQFRVVNAPRPRLSAQPRPRTATSSGGAATAATTAAAPIRSVLPAGVATNRLKRALPVVFGDKVQAAYNWEVTTGLSVGSSVPSLEHDFGPHLDPKRLYNVFAVKLTTQFPGEAPSIVQRSVTVVNPYHLMKNRGVLQPPVVSCDLNAVFKAGDWRASFTVMNPEPVDIVLSSLQIELHSEDVSPRRAGLPQTVKPVAQRVLPIAAKAAAVKPVNPINPAIALAVQPAAPLSNMLPAERAHIVLKAKTTTKINVVVPKAKLPKTAIAFAVHYTGKGPNNLPVQIAVHFDVPEHVTPLQLSPAVLQLLGDAGKRGLVANPKSVSTAELTNLVQRGVVSLDAIRAVHDAAPTHVLDAHVTPPNAVEGETCEPWNLPDVVPDGLACLPTAETQMKLMPARFMNAKKGDIILSPADGSLVSDVLLNVDPPQPFSHSGMMTRNQDEVTHSTASMDRMTQSDYLVGLGGSGGFRPDILKFGWPGVITQSVKHAVDPDPNDPKAAFHDPENGKPFIITGFSTLQAPEDLGGRSPTIVPAMVVKPNPLNETDEVRNKLHSIADFAAAQAGQSHYRFFCFTDPTVGLTTTAPDDAKWAATTFPTVCSSLIWMSIRQSGAEMDRPLKPQDINDGAKIAAGTPDGLYLYDAAERLNSGEVLNDRIQELVFQKAGNFGAAVTDALEDFANQVLNSFASDWSDEDATESDKWKQTSDANAVSPRNLMFYDAPLYGFSEPLIYRGERFEEVTIYRWKKVAQKGTLHGMVRMNGQPVAGADVQVSGQFTHSGTDGKFQLTVPADNLIVEAQKLSGGELLSGQTNITVAPNSTVNVTVDLKPPAQTFRRIIVTGHMTTVDKHLIGSDTPNSVEFNGFADLDPGDATHAVRNFDCIADDDVLGRLILTFDLQTDNSIRLHITIRVFDSNKPDTDDFDEGSLQQFIIGPGQSGHFTIFVDGENAAEATFDVTNAQNPS